MNETNIANPTNLIDGLLNEIERNIELKANYIEVSKLPNTNCSFAIACLDHDIQTAKNAISSNDIVFMLSAYNTLKGNEG